MHGTHTRCVPVRPDTHSIFRHRPVPPSRPVAGDRRPVRKCLSGFAFGCQCSAETGTGTFPRVVWVRRARCLSRAMLLSREVAFPFDELFCGGRPGKRSVASTPRCRAVCSTHGPQALKQYSHIRIGSINNASFTTLTNASSPADPKNSAYRPFPRFSTCHTVPPGRHRFPRRIVVSSPQPVRTSDGHA